MDNINREVLNKLRSVKHADLYWSKYVVYYRLL
jgi:hypothetical protein